MFHGEPNDDNKTFRELKLSEGLVLLPLIALIVFSGVYPKPMLDRIEPSVQRILTALDKQLVSPQNPDAQETTDDGKVVEATGEVKK